MEMGSVLPILFYLQVFACIQPIYNYGQLCTLYHFTFPGIVRINTSLFLQDIENDLTRSTNFVLPHIMQRLLYTLTQDRKISLVLLTYGRPSLFDYHLIQTGKLANGSAQAVHET